MRIQSRTNMVAPTNRRRTPPENSGIKQRQRLKIGVALLIGAVVLAILMVRRARKTGRISLITRSMEKNNSARDFWPRVWKIFRP